MEAADYLENYPKYVETSCRLYRADVGNGRREEMRNSGYVCGTSANTEGETMKVETSTVRRQGIKVKTAEECSRRQHDCSMEGKNQYGGK